MEQGDAQEKPIHVLIKDRLDKLAALRAQGVEPYPYSFNKTHSTQSIHDAFPHLAPEEHAKETVCTAGRVVAFRKMGKASFCHLMDESGKIQCYFRFDDLGETQYNILKRCDIGDIIGVAGEPFKTKTGELSVYCRQFTLLTKSIRPLPENFTA